MVRLDIVHLLIASKVYNLYNYIESKPTQSAPVKPKWSQKHPRPTHFNNKLSLSQNKSKNNLFIFCTPEIVNTLKWWVFKPLIALSTKFRSNLLIFPLLSKKLFSIKSRPHFTTKTKQSQAFKILELLASSFIDKRQMAAMGVTNVARKQDFVVLKHLIHSISKTGEESS